MIHIPLMSEITHWAKTAPPKPAASVPDESPTWRPDIDGLRGIAVLSLMAVHMFPSWGRGGGLIGLDMFLVISGFLITSQLLGAHAGGHIDLPSFYARRIQRIVPSLCLVLLFCIAFSWLFISPGDALQTGKQVASMANLGGESAPLLHLGALAFQVQFYLVWPTVVAWLLRSGRSVVVVVCALLILSLLLPSRAWELMVGALLACMTARGSAGGMAWLRTELVRSPTVRRHVPDVLAWTGVGLLGTSLWRIDGSSHLPGWWALLPTMGTFALLASGSKAAINRRLLSHPVLRFYGTISYPLYLWHWPLLAFLVLMGIPLTQELRITILIASVVLAALTCELLEKPARSFGTVRYAPLALLGVLAATGALGWLLMHTEGLLLTGGITVQPD